MKKSLGQHFLINDSVINKILENIIVTPKMTIIEIGPGEGFLTRPLINFCQENDCEFLALEKDDYLAEKLLQEGVNVKNTDALEFLKNDTSLSNYTVVGNIPYYITGNLLRTLSEKNPRPNQVIIMIQSEVADRILAEPPKMNLLAAATQVWASGVVLATLSPENFNPPPKVYSSIISLKTRDKVPDDLSFYYDFIRTAFKQPRKTFYNNLRERITPAEARRLVGDNENIRAQELDINTLTQMAKLYTSYIT
ncbi:MAG: ribosomal RNA small subunit methyltransferase A [Candidatus Harrisonbacteria bacterium CG10_big_fil_rev_8_21_14_0_10_38_8]|uniref:Ribosomal RNA small subunit methyltransferase A n=1 Tax=Candidatus Harrisonbacteria bacterium CG10_big_fil_rev_8_21_14_0_10_38_8 TaxID=1974582 RepID=A0A2M6WKA1_9BACT|nr:MAG: ribosomal RNA small subunit methyltransferase A [Candidatus Harrisonbacteria bacterium CG10_big_fil_rev_8_21_14_0_10_38_8]